MHDTDGLPAADAIFRVLPDVPIVMLRCTKRANSNRPHSDRNTDTKMAGYFSDFLTSGARTPQPRSISALEWCYTFAHWRNAMATISDIFGDEPISENKPVAAVVPADLKSVWAILVDADAARRARFPVQQVQIPLDLSKSACSAGADIRAVFFRVSQLWILKILSEGALGLGPGDLINPWLNDGKPDDAVFKVVATLPMVGLPPIF